MSGDGAPHETGRRHGMREKETSRAPWPRISPPPRPGSDRDTTPPLHRRGSHRAVRLGGWVLLALLAGAAVAVFTWLPGWVEERGSLGRGAGEPRQQAATRPAAAPLDSAAAGTESAQGPSPAREAAAPPPSLPEARESGTDETTLPSPRSGQTAPPHPGSAPPSSSPPGIRGGNGAAETTTDPPAAPPREDFRRAMSAGLAALEGRDWTAAEASFHRALELQPAAPEAADGLARAETAARRTRLVRLESQTKALVERERWAEALELYRRALEIDPTVTFARRGARESRERARLDEALTFHLENPRRFSSPEVRREAGALLARARGIEPAGPRLQDQRRRLAEQLDAWSRPVQARLLSDRRTEVTVFRIGPQGTFEERLLTLTPGTYTVLGERPGYRQVRRELVIRPGETPEPLRVECEEEI